MFAKRFAINLVVISAILSYAMCPVYRSGTKPETCGECIVRIRVF